MKTVHLFATPPGTWYAKWICKILGAKTFHWGWVIEWDKDAYIISESAGKGTAISRLANPDAYFYKLRDFGEIDPHIIYSIHSQYGLWKYDWDVALKTVLWWLIKHYFGKLIPRWYDKEVNCQEWICLIASELGVKIIPDNEYPHCINLEHSPYLELDTQK